MYARKYYDKQHQHPAYRNDKAPPVAKGNNRQQARAEVRAELAILEG